MAIAGIGAAIAGIATGAGSAIGAGEQASGAKTAAADTSSGAVQAAQIQATAAEQAAELQAQTAQQALQYQQEESQLSLNQYNQQQQNLQPYRNLGAFALGQAPSPAPAPLTLPGLPNTSTTPLGSSGTSGTPTGTTSLTSGSGSSPANVAPLLSALNQGQSPQAVIAQMNASQGLQSGSSYAWRSIPTAPGGGVVEVPGGAYLAPGPNGVWGYTAGPSGGSSTPAATAGPVTLNYTPSNIGTPVYTPPVGVLSAPTPQTAAYTPLSQIGAA